MKVVVCFAALALALPGQDARFGAQTRLVLVPVTVTNATGEPIDGLESKDFQVFDNGRLQKLSVDAATTGVAPIALTVLIQASGISKPVLEKVRKIGSMIEPVVTGERGCAAVAAFSEQVNWLAECTRDADRLTRAFAEVRAGGDKSGRMLDAVSAAIDRLKMFPHFRRVILLIAESRDRGSETGLDDVLSAAQNAGVTVYAANYSAFRTAFTTKSSATADPDPPKRPRRPSEETGTMSGAPPQCGPHGCPQPPVPVASQRADILGGFGELVRLGQTNTSQALARGTGGTTFPFARLKGLEEVIQRFGTELHSEYVLAFTPDDNSAGYHQLEVRVTREGAKVRSRPGYWSTQPGGP